MAKTRRRQPHPGTVLQREYLAPNGLSATALAQFLRVPANRISDIARGRRGITADTALRLERYFGTPADHWLELQNRYDLDRAAEAGRDQHRRIPRRAG